MGVKPGEPKFPPDKEDFLPIDIESVWEAMEECQNLGLVKSIGVSNFSSKKIDLLLSKAKIPPAVNQVSHHVFSIFVHFNAYTISSHYFISLSYHILLSSVQKNYN